MTAPTRIKPHLDYKRIPPLNHAPSLADVEKALALPLLSMDDTRTYLRWEVVITKYDLIIVITIILRDETLFT